MKIMRRTMGICGEHNEFVKTARYASLPRKHELEEEERERKKERTGETDEPAEELKPYLNDGEMEQKLEELANEALKNGSPEPAAGSETKDQPETGSAEKPAAPKSTGGKDAPPSHSRVPAESRAYDARGSVKPGPQPAKARLDIKR